MKEIGLDTVGGRIRKVRQDAKQSMREFAAALDITGNYVGLLERGERNPSPELLRKISSVMGVSYNWLAQGDQPEQQESGAPRDAADVASDPAQTVNPRLYLSVVLGMVPAIKRDMLGPMLAVPAETIDGILAGEDVAYSPRWRTGYSVLAQNLDLPALCRDLRNLEAYLAWEEVTTRNAAMLRALKRHMAKDFEAVEVRSINGQEPATVPINVPYVDMVLESKGEQDYTWCFEYVPEQDDPEDFFAEDVLRRAVALAEQRGCKVSIVLTSEAEFRKVCDYCDRLEVNVEASAEQDVPTNLPHNVSFIHFDRRTEGIDELEFSEDELLDPET